MAPHAEHIMRASSAQRRTSRPDTALITPQNGWRQFVHDKGSSEALPVVGKLLPPFLFGVASLPQGSDTSPLLPAFGTLSALDNQTSGLLAHTHLSRSFSMFSRMADLQARWQISVISAPLWAKRARAHRRYRVNRRVRGTQGRVRTVGMHAHMFPGCTWSAPHRGWLAVGGGPACVLQSRPNKINTYNTHAVPP